MPTTCYQNHKLEITEKPSTCTVCSSPEIPSKHFGCYSCTACNAFFRRSVVLQIDFKCQYNNICDVSYNVKNVCKSCRFNMCLLMGMKKDKVQKPRGKYLRKYSKETLHDDIIINKSSESSLTTIMASSSSKKNNTNDSVVVGEPYTCEYLVDQFIIMEQMTEKRRKILTGADPLVILRNPIQEYQIDKNYKIVPFNFKQFNECIRGVCLLSFDYLTSMPLYNSFNDEDKYVLFRGIFFLTCILDSSFFTYKSGLYKQGYYAGIEGMVSSIYDDTYGWNTEGNITREMKLTLLKPIYKNIFESLILPMSILQMKPWEFASLKGMAIWSICLPELTIDGRERGKKIETLLIKGLSQKYDNNEDISLRVGQLILLMSNLHVIYANTVEFFTRIEVFNLVELDDVIKAILNGRSLSDLNK